MNTDASQTTSSPEPAVGTSRLCAAGNVVLNYFVSGSGETVVLLPAFARPASSLNDLATMLNAAGYRTVAVEPRGVGRSRGPLLHRTTMRDLAADVACVVRDLADVGDGKVHVLGQAFGNRVARAFATHYPQHVRSVILLASGGLIRTPRTVLLKYVFHNRLMPRRRRIEAARRAFYAPGNEPPRGVPYRPSLRALWTQASALRTPIREWWHGGTAPILCIHGEQDRVAPVANALALKREWPERVELALIREAGHALFAERPGEVRELIVNFLRKHALFDQTSPPGRYLR
jgi:pimeloyl-ACP methyl ester carboxylesterase